MRAPMPGGHAAVGATLMASLFAVSEIPIQSVPIDAVI
jgi:hypothetical protein